MTTNFSHHMMGFPSRSCNTLREEHFDLGGNHSDTSDDMDVRSVISDDSETSLDTSLEDNQGTNNCCSDDFPSADPQETEQVNPSNLADNPGGEDIDSTQSDNVAVEDTLDNVDIDEAYKCVQVRAGNPADKEAMALVNMNRYIALILLYFVFLNALYMQGSKVVQDEITKLVKDLLARYPILFGAVVCSMKKDNFQLGKMVKDRDAQLWDKDRNIISLEGMLQTALANKDPGTEANLARELSELKKDRNLAITQLHTSRIENAQKEQYIRELQTSREYYQKVIDGLQCQSNEQKKTEN